MRYGFDYITSGNYAGDWQELFFTVDSVVTLTTNKGDSFSGVTFSKGQSIVGPYEGIAVTSGAVIAYKRSDTEKRLLFTGLLDTYGGAAAAYSLRKLSKDYTGSAIRVRESATSTEADIGFNPDGTLDTTALLAHTGANDGFVVTWFDQSGNAKNAIQSTAANQPQIVSGGSVILENGQAAIDFDGNNDFLSAASIYSATFTEAFICGVQNSNGITNSERTFGIGDGSGGALGAWLAPDDTIRFNDGSSSWSSGSYITGSQVLQSLQKVGVVYNGYQNGSNVITIDRGSESQRDNGINIGNNGSNVSCNIQEVISWESDQSANRTAIESNINDFYSIYP